MNRKNMLSRRSFLKASALAGTIGVVGGGASTSLLSSSLDYTPSDLNMGSMDMSSFVTPVPGTGKG